jgi:ketosteroid isomerase-like protein
MTAKDFVSQIFERWEKGDSGPFFDALAADVVWTAAGTTPISGTYRGKADYLDKVYKPLLSVFSGPTSCRVKRILADGDMVAVEWHGETPTVSGVPYAQDYCWVIRVSEEGSAIREVAGYFDTALVQKLLSATTE